MLLIHIKMFFKFVNLLWESREWCGRQKHKMISREYERHYRLLLQDRKGRQQQKWLRKKRESDT